MRRGPGRRDERRVALPFTTDIAVLRDDHRIGPETDARGPVPGGAGAPGRAA